LRNSIRTGEGGAEPEIQLSKNELDDEYIILTESKGTGLEVESKIIFQIQSIYLCFKLTV
jgi:hypothetical protein